MNREIGVENSGDCGSSGFASFGERARSIGGDREYDSGDLDDDLCRRGAMPTPSCRMNSKKPKT